MSMEVNRLERSHTGQVESVQQAINGSQTNWQLAKSKLRHKYHSKTPKKKNMQEGGSLSLCILSHDCFLVLFDTYFGYFI